MLRDNMVMPHVPDAEVYSTKTMKRLAIAKIGRIGWWQSPSGVKTPVVCVWDVNPNQKLWTLLEIYQERQRILKQAHRERNAGLTWKQLKAERKGHTIFVEWV